jgi:acylphosphatase
MSADGVKYVRNQLLVSAKMDCTKEKMESLGSAYGFEIVGYIELTQDYQIEFARDMEEAELLKMIKILEEEDCVSMCTLNYVMELSYD